MKRMTFFLSPALLLVFGVAQAQTFPDDFQNQTEAWGGTTVPGIACKTRTNNEATVRNLAMGVFNQDSSSPVALNCGWPAPLPASRNLFNDLVVKGFLDVRFVRTAGTPLAQASDDTFCAIFAADALSPNSPAVVDGAEIGMAEPTFSGSVGSNEIVSITLDSDGVTFPASEQVMFTAFCRIEQGVRIQNIVYRPDLTDTWP